jgi:phage tail protein X
MSDQVYTVGHAARLDTIAEAIYGTERTGTVEALLSANPGLGVLSLLVPRGTVIVVPDRPVAASSGYTRPWE